MPRVDNFTAHRRPITKVSYIFTATVLRSPKDKVLVAWAKSAYWVTEFVKSKGDCLVVGDYRYMVIEKVAIGVWPLGTIIQWYGLNVDNKWYKRPAPDWARYQSSYAFGC